MARFELDRLFGMALTDARFFRHLREDPQKVVAQFELTESEARAVLDIAPVVSSTEDLAVRLDSWMTHKVHEPVETHAEGQFIGLDSAVRQFSLSDDVLVQMIRKGRIRLSKQDVSQVAIHAVSNEYA